MSVKISERTETRNNEQTRLCHLISTFFLSGSMISWSPKMRDETGVKDLSLGNLNSETKTIFEKHWVHFAQILVYPFK